MPFAVFIEERIDETSDGGKIFDQFEKLDDAIQCVRIARIVYPNGAAWAEDERGNVIPID